MASFSKKAGTKMSFAKTLPFAAWSFFWYYCLPFAVLPVII